jgi:hypothetical protein
MPATPKFLGPDLVLREHLVFSTTVPTRFLTGEIDTTTADLQVSIRGAEFASDPDYVYFEGSSFTIPNPTSFPDGLDLSAGVNLIEVRAIDTVGSISAPGIAEVNLVQESDIGVLVQPPTGVTLERFDDYVRVTLEGIDDSRVTGYNFYASTSPGGGTRGYSILNIDMVSSGAPTQIVEPLRVMEVDSEIAVDSEGNHVADPLRFSVVGTQQDEDENVLQMDFNEYFEVPETVNNIRTDMTVSEVRTVTTYSFDHNRQATATSTPPTIPNGDFTAIGRTELLYYVATAVWYDPVRRVEFESSFSPEVSGSPLTVTTGIGSFPRPNRQDIVANIISSIHRSRREIDLKPGSSTDDTFTQPFSREADRIRFLIDFLHRASSTSTLLQIDDPDLSGESVPVAQSEYKLALKAAFNLTNNTDVQAIIDQAFEKLASNYGLTRLRGNRSRGELTWFTTTRPTSTRNIPIGSRVSSGSTVFRTTTTAQITLENIASFYSGVTGRYSVRVSIRAETAGSAGNVGPGQIRTVLQGPSGLSVINEARTFGGTDLESNRDLSRRIQNVISSVDSGTLEGIRNRSVAVPGVVEVSVVTPGNVLMQRDYDPVTKQHHGGRVDVWVRGRQEGTVTDSFAFSFEQARDVLFEPVGNPSDYLLKALDPQLSASKPIIEMLDIPSYGLGLRNDSTGEDFDLTDVEVVGYNLIQLSTDVPQPSLTLADVVRGDYRFRTSDRFVFPRQPVARINSLTGSVTGAVTRSAISLVRADSPLRNGRSTNAGDYMLVTDTGDPTSQIPSGTPTVVTEESHVILGEYIEYLDNLGINALTVEVYNEDRTTLYKGPFDPSGSNDYTIIPGNETTPLGIKRTTTGAISSGETLSVDYEHDENFIVSYDVDFLISAVQEDLDAMRHVTADILVKSAVAAPVDVEATVVLQRSSSQPLDMESLIRTNVTNFVNALGLGTPLRQSDVISVVDTTRGVSYVTVPMTKMVHSEGTLIIREGLTTTQEVDVFYIEDWSTDQVYVWLVKEELNNSTTIGGGPDNEYRGVYQDDDELLLQTVDPNKLGEGEGRSYIIGDEGLVIPGYSDDTTLRNQGFRTDAEISAQRQLITGNRVLVSMLATDIPINYTYSVTYIVGIDSGVKNILPQPTESLTVGDLTFTYDEDRVETA